MVDDTIAAISTSIGASGIGIIRVSGPDAILIVDKIFRSSKNKKLIDVKTFTLNHGHIIAEQKEIDEVLVSVMREPHSFTGENVVEVNCHGGLIAVKEVLNAVIKAGARHAEPGEFSKRAFLNGRIDLAQAESIMDLINAKTKKGMNVALKQLDGVLSREVNDLRDMLLDLLAQIEAGIDFPEHDVEEVSRENIKDKSIFIAEKLHKLIDTADTGKVFREGLKTAIVGRPNVGKSSLLNALLKESRAIVTDIPGTTRDVIEEVVNIRGIPLRLIDTAGIRETEDIVEKIGVEKTRQVLEEADLILVVIDASEPLNDHDRNILKNMNQKNLILIANKTDMGENIDYNKLKKYCSPENIIKMSVINGTGLENLEKRIEKMVYAGLSADSDDILVTNVRHKQSLEKAYESISDVIEAVDMGMPTDCLSIDIKTAWESLGEITGDTVSDGLLNEIFSKFCIGK